MRRAALWLFLIMIASYSIAFSAMKDTHISWDEVDGLMVSDGIVLFSEKNRTNMNESKTADVSQVKKIEVKAVSSDVRLVPDDREDALIELRGYYAASSTYIPPKLIVTEKGDTLFIEVEHTKQISISSRVSLTLEIILPESYVNEIEIEGVSSDVNVEFGEFSDLSIKTISGDIKSTSSVTGKTDIRSTSGEVDLEGVLGAVVVDTTSGDIDVQLDKILNDVNLKSVSGEVQMTVPESEAFSVSFSTTSGDIQSTKELSVEKMSDRKLVGSTGNAEFVLDVTTVSGDITLR